MKSLSQVLLILLIAAAFVSCDKEDPRPDYYYRFKVDGVQKEYKANKDASILFLEEPNSSNHIMLFSMVTGKDSEKNSIIISLRTPTKVESGVTYHMQEPLTVQGNVLPTLAVIYFDETGKAYGATLLEMLNEGAADDASLIFTQIVTEGSYGKFDAVTFAMPEDDEEPGDLSSRQPLLITDGEFFLPNFISLL